MGVRCGLEENKMETAGWKAILEAWPSLIPVVPLAMLLLFLRSINNRLIDKGICRAALDRLFGNATIGRPIHLFNDVENGVVKVKVHAFIYTEPSVHEVFDLYMKRFDTYDKFEWLNGPVLSKALAGTIALVVVLLAIFDIGRDLSVFVGAIIALILLVGYTLLSGWERDVLEVVTELRERTGATGRSAS
jgi:hypothetical protein